MPATRICSLMAPIHSPNSSNRHTFSMAEARMISILTFSVQAVVLTHMCDTLRCLHGAQMVVLAAEAEWVCEAGLHCVMYSSPRRIPPCVDGCSRASWMVQIRNYAIRRIEHHSCPRLTLSEPEYLSVAKAHSLQWAVGHRAIAFRVWVYSIAYRVPRCVS